MKAGILTFGSVFGFVALGVGLDGVVIEPFASGAIADGGDMVGILVEESGMRVILSPIQRGVKLNRTRERLKDSE